MSETDDRLEDGVADAFRLPDAARLSVRALEKASLAVTEIRLNSDGFGLTDPIPYSDTAMLAVQLRAIPFHEAMSDGVAKPINGVVAGDTIFYDMRHDPRANVPTKSHSLHFLLSREVLDGVAEAVECHRIEGLVPAPGTVVHDQRLVRLARSILPALKQPTRTTGLFASHFMLSLGVYVAWRYGGMQAPQQPEGHLGGLEMRLVTEFMSARLDGDIELGELARLCGMPLHRFVVAFRETTGMAPHQWLGMRRLELAKSLLRRGQASVVEIAEVCGFADETHLVDCFVRTTGSRPFDWQMQVH